MTTSTTIGSVAAAANRTADIANVIRAAMSSIIDADGARSDASEALQETSGSATNARMNVIVALADAAHQGNWTVGEIEAAAAAASKLGNMTLPKSVATFMSETKRAMNPKVREYVPLLIGVVHTAWEAEGLLDKSAPRPCRKAFRREYHAVLKVFLHAKDEGIVLRTPEDFVLFAGENDPDLDYEKVYQRLQTIRSSLAEFARDFPVDGFTEADSFLESIGKDALKNARESVLRRQAEHAAEHKLAPVKAPKPSAHAAPPQAASAGQSLPAELAMPEVDPIDAALNDLTDIGADVTLGEQMAEAA